VRESVCLDQCWASRGLCNKIMTLTDPHTVHVQSTVPVHTKYLLYNTNSPPADHQRLDNNPAYRVPERERGAAYGALLVDITVAIGTPPAKQLVRMELHPDVDKRNSLQQYSVHHI